ncbi:MAG: hypothetical protein APF84_11235 [Gracilibacter sp. BRH_c7a]|nr:MAG: hypothetical protein APF84_11235 [Gracilibacter sp. BRH_c7a]
MITALIILFVLAAITSVLAYKKGDGSHRKGFKIAQKTLISMWPLLIIAFLMAGFIQVAIPPDLIRSWLGAEAGLRGVLIGSIAGALIPGGPYVAFPIIASVVNAGAGLGTAVSFITGWAMLGMGAIPFELAIIGSRFMFLRLALVLIIPPLSGIIVNLIP